MVHAVVHNGEPFCLIPVLADYSGYPAHRISESHFHAVYHIVPVLEGEAWLQRDTDRVRLCPGTVVVINPGGNHVFLTYSQSLRIVAFNFYLVPSVGDRQLSGTLPTATLESAALRVPFAQLTPELGWANSALTIEPASERWGRLVEEVRRFRGDVGWLAGPQEAAQDPVRYRWYQGRCTALLLGLLSILSRPDWPGQEGAGSGHQVIGRIDRALREQLEQKLDLRMLAGRVGLSPTYLSELFHSRTGTTLSRRHSALRISRACERLRDHSQPIARIALELGYSSPQHFCAAFRRERRLSPREYRDASGAG